MGVFGLLNVECICVKFVFNIYGFIDVLFIDGLWEWLYFIVV